MLSRFLCFAALTAMVANPASSEPEVSPVWPGKTPDEPAGITAKKKPDEMGKDEVMRVRYVDTPTLTWYPAPKSKANGAAVVVCPGGGYNILAWNKEGTEVAEWLNTVGVSAAVLKYRVPRRDTRNPHPWPLQDVQRAVRIVRSQAATRGIDPERIGVLGFSAGGHLTVMAGTHWKEKSYQPIDEIDTISCRPDFLIPIYPAYLGDKSRPGKLDPTVHVTKETPPTFIAITHDDADRAIYAALLYAELKKAGVQGELHIYSQGGHGYGLRPSDDPVHTWPQRCAEWMKTAGLLQSKAQPGS